MMSRNSAARGSADYRRSWVYWANMHLHFGDDCAGPIVGSGMNGVQTYAASTADEAQTWCRCEHGTEQFLTWHRMYLWYFERVLQEAAGDQSLRLPYWDYEANGGLPAAYREQTYVNEQGQTVSNPLRATARQPGLNSGASALSGAVTSTTNAMSAAGYSAFNSRLESTPHGAVHCAVVTGGCPNGLLGSVPVAALDPVFYAHHTNIDRLYECWLKGDPSRLPNNASQLNATFTFVDGDGSTLRRRVGDMLTLAQLNYSYAAGAGCPIIESPNLAQVTSAEERPAMNEAPEQVLAAVGETRIEAGATTVPLPLSPQAEAALPRGQRNASSGRTYLKIEGLKYDEAPGGLYNVFLRGQGGRREEIGVINFFGLASSRSTQSAGHAGHLRTQGSFQFDVTDALKRLDIGPNAPPSLIFEATTGLAGSSSESAEQQMNSKANVRFEGARLVKGP